LQPLKRANLQVNTDLNALTQVLAWFDQFNGPPIPSQTWLECQLALVEGFTNAVRHAHRGRPTELTIDMEVAIAAKCIELRIWDYGEPFDMLGKIKSLPQEMDSTAEGGRGLKLIQRIADFLSYTRSADERNCLLIIKDYPQTAASE